MNVALEPLGSQLRDAIRESHPCRTIALISRFGIRGWQEDAQHLSKPMSLAGRTVFEPYSGNPIFFSRFAQRGSGWRESKVGNRMTASSSSSSAEWAGSRYS